jgi:NitT/TauT family transport system permease protein
MDVTSTRQKRVESVLLPLFAGVVLVVAWHVAVVLSGTKVLPSPWIVAKGAGDLLRGGVLLRYARDSLVRVGIGFGVGVITGVPLGLAAGLYPAVDRAVNPVIQVLRPISPLAWIPIAIVIFGITPAAAISLIFLGSVFPIIVSSAEAVRNVPRMYVDAGRNFGLSRFGLLARVIFPAALPQMLTGLRIAFGIAWIVVVAAEMIAVDSGLGYLIMDARNAGKRYDLVVAGMLIIGLLGLLLDAGLRSVERLRAMRWGFRQDG